VIGAFIINSEYRYNGEILSKPTTIFVVDHHYDEVNGIWPLQQLLDNSKCDPYSHTLLFDMNLHDDIFVKYNPLCIPYCCTWLFDEFEKENIVPEWTNKTKTFNFMINKPRPHRIRLLELVEQLNLTNYTYSLPWQENPYTSLPVTNYMIGTETQMPQGIRSGSIRNSQSYKQLLQKAVFEPSCISLITEPTYVEKEALIDEKTIMAIYGGTIPIWVGGWRYADAMKELGFDVFDDIVDHSYQFLEDPIERTDKSIELNLDLLSSFTMTPQILERLQHNLDLMLDGVFEKQVEKQLRDTNFTLSRDHAGLCIVE
tara:strand:+ start:886 stop:1827 length:942 start_codon:yes stop_codon:yes gene_type:complete